MRPFFSELHLFLGLANKIFDELQLLSLEQVRYGQMDCDIFAICHRRFSIVHENYMGKFTYDICQFFKG